MMNKHTHPHMSCMSTTLASLPGLLGLAKNTMRPGQGDRVAAEFQHLQALKASTAKQFASAGADNRARRVSLESVLSGATPKKRSA